MSKRKEEVHNYFEKKAARYDDVDSQHYWRFSDALLWEILSPLLLEKYKISKLLDAGAGTGRWGLRIAEYAKCELTLFDASSAMLAEAEKKIEDQKAIDPGNVKIQVGDLDDPDQLPTGKYDTAIAFHNVLSFVEDPRKATENIRSLLETGSPFAAIVVNHYHAVYFSILTRRLHELKVIMNKKMVKFNDDVPPMHTFTPDSLHGLFQEGGFTNIHVFGFPVTIYPNMEETTLSDNSAEAKSLFADNDTFRLLLDVEKQLILREDAAARGNMLLAIGEAS